MSYRCRNEWRKSLLKNIPKNNNSSARIKRITTTTNNAVSATSAERNVDRVRNWLENVGSEPLLESPCPSLDGSSVKDHHLSFLNEILDNHASKNVLPPSPQLTSPANKVAAVSENGRPEFRPKEKDTGQLRIVKRKLAFHNILPVTRNKEGKPSALASEVNRVENISHTTNRSEHGLKRKLSPVKQSLNNSSSENQHAGQGEVLINSISQAKKAASVADSTSATMQKSGLLTPSPPTFKQLYSDAEPGATSRTAPSPLSRKKKHQINEAALPEPSRDSTNTQGLPPTPTPTPRKSLSIQTALLESPHDSSFTQSLPRTPTPKPRKSLSIQGAESMSATPITPCLTPRPAPRTRNTPGSSTSTLSLSPDTSCLTPRPAPRTRTTKEQYVDNAALPLTPSSSFSSQSSEFKAPERIQTIMSPTPRPRISLQSPGSGIVHEGNIMILPVFDDLDHQISTTSMDSASKTLPIRDSSLQVVISDGIAIVPPSSEATAVDIPFDLEVENAEVTVNGEVDDILAAPLQDDILNPVTPQKINSRKRVKRLSKQDQAKQALNRGLEHFNVRGKLIPARKMGEGCSANICRFKCHSKISKMQRENLFKTYWALGERQRQDDFLRECIIITDPKVHKKGEEVKHKTHTIKYSFKFHGVGQVFVCKTMFLSTLGITESPVRTQVMKLERGIAGSPDKRGRHAKVLPEVRKKNDGNIEEHIRSFKTVPSHFCRSRSKRKYLSASLTCRHMWRLYKLWMRENHPNDQVKSEKYYRNIFNTRFNLGFHKPKKDRCDLCLVYEIATASQKKRMKTKYDQHLRNKMNAHKARTEDKLYAKRNKGTSAYCLMDLQQVISLPKTEAGMVFYKRKFSVYNFTIYDGVRKKGYCYLWDESEAKRGANEIASCVLQFIMQKVQDGITLFIFWSDNCGGQNKNMFLFSMYSWAAAKFKVKIIHRYMERGHTMNEADSMHATIGRAARHEQIFEPKDLVPIITSAKRSGNQYDILMMGPKILDFHPLAENYQNWKKKDAKWNQVREIIIDPEKAGKVLVKHDLSSKDSLEIKFTKVGRQVNLATYEFPKAFNRPLTLKASKLKDLAVLCNELVIPSSSHPFYKNLINFPHLNSPLIVDSDTESEDENEDQNPADFLLSSEDEAGTDYEEERRIAIASKSAENNEGEREPSDGEDGASDSGGEEMESDENVAYDEDSFSSSEGE